MLRDLSSAEDALVGYFVLLVTARWHLKVPSGGGFVWAERTCNSGILWYNHDTLEWDDVSAPGGVETA